jgi:GNAT superfamily N-acetyltransferase
MIRRAEDHDLEALIAMGQALHDESPRYQGMAFNPEKLRRLYHALKGTLLAETGAVFVAELGGEVIGMCVCKAVDRWFSDELFVTDLTLYVKPAHRGGMTGPRLIRAMERWAQEQGIADLAFGVSTEIHAAQTVAMYERMGYRLAGYTMVKRHGN